MIEQLSNAVSFFAFFTESKVGKTGLIVTVDVWEVTKAGVATEIVTAGSATAVGDGLYVYVLSAVSVDTEGEYVCVFKTATSTVDQQHIPALWSIQRGGVENLNAAVNSRSSHAAADVWVVATRALTDKAGFSLSAAGVQAIWDALTSALTTAGSIGKRLVDNLDAAITSRMATFTYTAPDNTSIGTAATQATAAATSAASADSKATTIQNRLGAWTGSARNTVLGAFQALFRKDVDATVPSDVNANLGLGVGVADNTTDSAQAIADALANTPTTLLDLAAGVETGITVRQAMRLILAASAGKLSGAATTTIVIRDANDVKPRITATVDTDGNRTAITLDAS